MEVEISAFAAVVFLIATTFIAVWLNRFSEIEIEEERVAMQLLMEYPTRRVAEFCSNTSLDCYVIFDTMHKFEGGILALRVIREKFDAGLAISDARLHIPEPMSYKTLDTRKWKVDKNYVYMKYARTMASGVFFSQAVKYNSGKESNILMIGLGGGIISGYLGSRPSNTFNITVAEIDPVMKAIAKNYFQFEESEKQRIVIEDGLDFIKKASRNSIKYNAILVDANINKMAKVVAPPPSFLNDDPISDFSKCLAEKGVLIVNVITPEMHKQEADKILKLFERHFTFCILVPSGSYQRMLFCYNYEHPWAKDSKLINQHIFEVDNETGFHLLDGRPYFPEN